MYHKWQSYDVWFLRYEAWQTEFFVTLDQFLPFYPHNNPKNQNFEKMKKCPGDIIISRKWTKNHYHMQYGSWDMARNECKCYFFILGYFLPFYLPNSTKKSKFKKNEKNTRRYHDFTIVYQKSWSYVILLPRYGVWQTGANLEK